MSTITDYSLGTEAFVCYKPVASKLKNYNYFSVALAQSCQIYSTTKIVARALRTYNRSTSMSFSWPVRVFAAAVLPFSVCFEISRWSSDYQPNFWIKRTVHWVCDHTTQVTYAISIASSVALAIIGQPGMLVGVIITVSIEKMQNYEVLPICYCRVLKTANRLAVALLSAGAVRSVAYLATEIAGNIYFSQPVQQKPAINELITNRLIINKTVADIKNNPSHIHFKPEIEPEIEKDVKKLLTIFDKIKWHPTQFKELLAKDNYWIKRADTNTDPAPYIHSLREYISDACSDPKRLPSIELYLKIIIQCLHNDPEKCLDNKKLVLDVADQLRKNSQEGVNRLGEIAEECYEKINSFSLEQQVLQLLYKKRKDLFNKLFAGLSNKLFTKLSENPMFSFFIKASNWTKDALDSHMGLNFFSKSQTPSFIKEAVRAECMDDEGINAKAYFCDQEGGNFYTPRHIVDLLVNELGSALSWDSINQWGLEQNVSQDMDDIKNKVSCIQTAQSHLQSLSKVKQEHYCDFTVLKDSPIEKRNYFYNFIKQDCMDSFEVLKEKIQVEGDAEEFANKVCLSIEQAVHVYSDIEKLLVSVLLKMGVFQLKT